MLIQYDYILKQWVVWQVKNNAMFMIYSSKAKRGCKKFIENYSSEEKSIWI